MADNLNVITVIGGGLAGCEAALQLAARGYEVELLEMRPQAETPAHQGEDLAQLVCSNSLKSVALSNAHGLLKAELELLGCRLMEAARYAAVPAGAALAVDRDIFSARVTEMLHSSDLKGRVSIIRRQVTSLDEISGPVLLATGPLTSQGLMENLAGKLGQGLYFFDAVAPVIHLDSIDMSVAFRGSRYGKDGQGLGAQESEQEPQEPQEGQEDQGDYINCPMNKEEYLAFREALLTAETAQVKEFDRKMVFEGCMPIEELALRGEDTMRFGPMKPVGFLDPRTGRMPYALIQLRQDNMQGTLYNMVGFQTRLAFGEQKRVFSMIPGLGQARFARYGVMHRNTYLDGPRVLSRDLTIPALSGGAPDAFVMAAGQMTGVEGYVESIASGLCAALFMDLRLRGIDHSPLPEETLLGSLMAYVTGQAVGKFSPMPVNFGLLPPIAGKRRKREHKRLAMSERSLEALRSWKEQMQGLGIF